MYKEFINWGLFPLKNLLQTSQASGFPHFHEMEKGGCLFSKILLYKFPKHEVLNLYMFRDDNSRYLSLKIPFYKLQKHEAFHMYESGDECLS